MLPPDRDSTSGGQEIFISEHQASKAVLSDFQTTSSNNHQKACAKTPILRALKNLEGPDDSSWEDEELRGVTIIFCIHIEVKPLAITTINTAAACVQSRFYDALSSFLANYYLSQGRSRHTSISVSTDKFARFAVKRHIYAGTKSHDNNSINFPPCTLA